MILHLKLPNVICINQQSDLLMYSSGLFQRHIVIHIEMEGTPPVTSTQLNIPKHRLFSAALHPLFQNGAIFFTCSGELMFLVLLRSMLSEGSDEKTCLRRFLAS